MIEFWNERYADEEFIYGEQPNLFFKEQIEAVKPGKIFLPGEGEGRNGVWAATKGWKVYAADLSVNAKQKATALAMRRSVKFEKYNVGDIETMKLPMAYYDVVALIFLHLEPALRMKVHKQMIEALKPGGLLILEAFNKEQLRFDSGGPQRIDMLYTSDMLRADFSGLQLLLLHECYMLLNEGNYHQGEAAVVRLVGTKPLRD